VGPFLLDANVLIALAWPEHEFHAIAGQWFALHSYAGWATCPFMQAAFVRILSNPAFSANALAPQSALRVLEDNLKLPSHRLWPDSISVPESLKRIEGRFTGHRLIR
jgi:predicted nucleic acid-binding protein